MVVFPGALTFFGASIWNEKITVVYVGDYNCLIVISRNLILSPKYGSVPVFFFHRPKNPNSSDSIKSKDKHGILNSVFGEIDFTSQDVGYYTTMSEKVRY